MQPEDPDTALRRGMQPMRHVHLLDTAVSSGNRGDDIIVDRAKRQPMTVIGDAFISTSSSQGGLGRCSTFLNQFRVAADAPGCMAGQDPAP